ncbi:MAG: hypothetical protein DMG57_38135 [Acidobacteria bacterium]|nr:MAG: hypothetical protein DMG57_38135 [Acidobacteriota bacterium]
MADAEGERQHGDDGKCWVFLQRADSIASIARKLLQHLTGPPLSDFFFDLFQTAQLNEGRALRFRRAHPGTALLLSQLIQIRAQLFVEVAFNVRLREEIAAKTGQTAQE